MSYTGNGLSQRPAVSRRRLLTAALAGIAGPALVRPGSARAAPPLRLQLQWLKNVESAGQFVALKHGFFAKAGLDVSMSAGGPQIDPVALLASGASDIAMVSSPLSVMAARARGVPIVVLGCGTMKSVLGLAARADRHFTLPADLKGAKVGYQLVNRNLLEAILKANNLSTNDITTSVVTADPTMLIEGRIDLMTVSVLNVPLAMTQRGVPASTWLAYDLGVPLQGSVVTCLEGTMAERREDIVRFLGALGRGWAYSIAHPDEVAAMVVSEFGDGLSLEHETAYNRAQVPFISTAVTKSKGLFWIEKRTWEVANSVALDSGLASSPIDLNKLLQFTALEAAAMPQV
jgi:ABC-type nitrate/sulfonate/bicarbonate transport system substrate-binding protein